MPLLPIVYKDTHTWWAAKALALCPPTSSDHITAYSCCMDMPGR